MAAVFAATFALDCAEQPKAGADSLQAKSTDSAGRQAVAVPETIMTAPLENTRWKLTRVRADIVRDSDYQREPFVVLSSGRLSGSGGCNSVSGQYELKGAEIKIQGLVSTKMACAKGMERETLLLGSLPQANLWKITGRRFELSDSAGGLIAEFIAP